eukprot:2704440-Alexandrium_andersonii.AAC.1
MRRQSTHAQGQEMCDSPIKDKVLPKRPQGAGAGEVANDGAAVAGNHALARFLREGGQCPT